VRSARLGSRGSPPRARFSTSASRRRSSSGDAAGQRREAPLEGARERRHDDGQVLRPLRVQHARVGHGPPVERDRARVALGAAGALGPRARGPPRGVVAEERCEAAHVALAEGREAESRAHLTLAVRVVLEPAERVRGPDARRHGAVVERHGVPVQLRALGARRRRGRGLLDDLEAELARERRDGPRVDLV
jgi:hypothetical protein